MLGASFCALTGGLFGALASVFGKLLSSDGAFLLTYFGANSIVSSLYRPAMLLSMIISNIVMWLFITKGFHLSNSTAQISVLASASNFFLTALFGRALFGEPLPLLWWMGAIFIFMGSLLLDETIAVQESPEKKKSE